MPQVNSDSLVFLQDAFDMFSYSWESISSSTHIDANGYMTC